MKDAAHKTSASTDGKRHDDETEWSRPVAVQTHLVPNVGIVDLIVSFECILLGHVKRVQVFHDKFTTAEKTKARPYFVAVFLA